MKHEIVYTEDYALIVSDEQIGDVRPFIGRYHLEKGNMIYQFPTYLTDLTYCKLIIAHRPLTDAPILKEVPLLPEISQEEDVHELAEKEYYEQSKSLEDSLVDPIFDTSRFLVSGFKDGYSKAKEAYKYTEEDLINAYERGMNNIDSDGCHIDQPSDDFNDFIQSLQQPKRFKYFETVCDCQECGANKTGLSLDMGCENKTATITNSQGQTELVGSYIY